MSRWRRQIKTAILVICVANHRSTSTTVLLIFRKILMRAFRQKTIYCSGTIWAASTISPQNAIFKVNLFNNMFDWRRIFNSKVRSLSNLDQVTMIQKLIEQSAWTALINSRLLLLLTDWTSLTAWFIIYFFLIFLISNVSIMSFELLCHRITMSQSK